MHMNRCTEEETRQLCVPVCVTAMNKLDSVDRVINLLTKDGMLMGEAIYYQ